MTPPLRKKSSSGQEVVVDDSCRLVVVTRTAAYRKAPCLCSARHRVAVRTLALIVRNYNYDDDAWREIKTKRQTRRRDRVIEMRDAEDGS